MAPPLPRRAVCRVVLRIADRTGGPVRYRLALRILRRLAGALEAVLLALFGAGVAGEQAELAQLRLQRLVGNYQRAGDAVADRARPAGDAAAFSLYLDIELAGSADRAQAVQHLR